MSTHKSIDIICVVVIVLAVLLTVFFMNGSALGIQTIVDEDSESYTGSAYFTSNDNDGSWDTSSATIITMDGTDSSISGNGAFVYNGDVYISNAGYYKLSGSLTDGSVIVEAESSSKVWLLLDGVDITCADNAGLQVVQADKVFVTLAEGSENKITSGSEYSDQAVSDNVEGAIFSKDDITINGSGSLAVTTEYKHGIDANDDLVITGGKIAIQAVNDGIHANDSVRVREAELQIDVNDDGICASKDANGYIYIESGTVNMNECYEGIEAPVIKIAGGDTTINPSDDALNANGGSSEMGMGGGMNGGPGGQQDRGNRSMSGSAVDGEHQGGPGGGFGMASGGAVMPENMSGDSPDSSTGSADSSEETETYIEISGGTLTIVNESGRDADGLDSNGDIRISGGTIRISMTNDGGNSAIDYASENNGVCEISGGTVVACGSSGMAEAFSSSSTQCALLYNFSDGAEAGTNVTLSDSAGNTILSYDAPCSFNSVNLSAPEMKQGETYQLTIGNEKTEVTLDEVSTSLGTSENTMGGGQRGGMQNRAMDNGSVSGTAMSGRPEQTADSNDNSNVSESAVTGTPITELDAEVWMYLEISIILLIAGIGFAFLYKRR